MTHYLIVLLESQIIERISVRISMLWFIVTNVQMSRQ